MAEHERQARAARRQMRKEKGLTKDGKVNMCEALTKMLADEREEGIPEERIAEKLMKRFFLTGGKSKGSC